MSQPPDPSNDIDLDDSVDACDVDFTDAEQTADEDLPVTFGGEAP